MLNYLSIYLDSLITYDSCYIVEKVIIILVKPEYVTMFELWHIEYTIILHFM